MATANPHHEPALVLVVDDEPTQRALVRETLTTNGYRVIEAVTGEEGLQKFDTHLPDLVLLDVDMPGIDGFETCEAIRGHPRGHEVPVVMVTRMEDVESINQSYASGATDFLTKPINWTVLPYRVRYILRAAHHAIELEKSESRLNTAQHMAGLGYWEYECDSGELSISPTLADLFGLVKPGQPYTLDDILAMVSDVDRSEVEHVIKRAREFGEPFDLDHRVALTSGNERFFQHRGVVAQDKLGNPTRLTGTLLDVTVRKRSEAALARAKAEIEEANRLKDEFLNNISHEVRTPMNGVLGMLSLLRGTSLDDEQRDCLDTALSSAEALMTLINDLLDFSKLEAGFERTAPMRFSVPEVVQEVNERYSPLLGGKPVVLHSRVDSSVPAQVEGYATQIGKILGILVDNAVKFTDRGEINIDVTTGGANGNRIDVIFTVSDTGTGIQNDLRRRIFEPFTQVDGSTTRRHGGTGVGLAILKRVVDKMRGHVKVFSELDRGSTFVVTIPMSVGGGR